MISLYSHFFSVLISGIIVVSSCNQAKTISSIQDQSIIVDTTDCMPERKNQDTVHIAQGIIDRAGDSYFIKSTEDNRRYAPCNIPVACKTKGIKVKCVVIKKEIFPNERWHATPSILQSISIKE